MQVAFLGPAGTFTEEALRASLPGSHDEHAYATVYETVMAVQLGHAGAAIVPIENSLEGSVAATLDTLATQATRVRIVAEVVHPIRQCLIAAPGMALDAVRRVISHPQALAQCSAFLRERLGEAELAAATSTAEAVQAAIAAGAPLAAVGSRLAADLYAGAVLSEGIEDQSPNLTRFVWLAPAGTRWEAGGEAQKTSIVFWGFNDRSPGALHRVLGDLAGHGINLTKIESRPRGGALGSYIFFADLEGGEEHLPVRDALQALSVRVEDLRVLGSYPAAVPPGT